MQATACARSDTCAPQPSPISLSVAVESTKDPSMDNTVEAELCGPVSLSTVDVDFIDSFGRDSIPTFYDYVFQISIQNIKFKFQN